MTVRAYRGVHFRAGIHLLNAGLSVAPRAEATNCLIKTWFPDIFGLRVQCDALSNYAAPVVFYSLPTSTLGHTETHPPMTVSFSGSRLSESVCKQIRLADQGQRGLEEWRPPFQGGFGNHLSTETKKFSLKAKINSDLVTPMLVRMFSLGSNGC